MNTAFRRQPLNKKKEHMQKSVAFNDAMVEVRPGNELMNTPKHKHTT